MSRWWYIVALVPFLVLLGVSRYRPVSLQPRLTMAGDSRRFGAVVAASGGVRRVKLGLWLDVTFIGLFAATVPTLLYLGSGWWLVPVVAAGLDLSEDGGALVLLTRGGSTVAYRMLWLVAAVKLAAYAATLAAVGVAAYRGE